MLTKFSLILGISLVFLGIVIVFSSEFEAFANLVASPFCKEIEADRFDNIYCINGDDRQELSALFGFLSAMVIMAGSLVIVSGIVIDMIISAARENHLLKFGEAAEAMIIGIDHTGVRVNGQPMLKFRLRVSTSYDAPYEAESRKIMPFGMMGRLAIGMTVPVKYDPKKPQDVALDFKAMQLSPIAAFGGTYQINLGQVAQEENSLTEKLRELEESYKAGLITQQEYEATRQRLLNTL